MCGGPRLMTATKSKCSNCRSKQAGGEEEEEEEDEDEGEGGEENKATYQGRASLHLANGDVVYMADERPSSDSKGTNEVVGNSICLRCRAPLGWARGRNERWKIQRPMPSRGDY